MAIRPPQCAVNMEQRLAALRRDQDIDGLRVYLIKYNLFPRNRDPHNSPIRVEELKELVKHWKLHRQRGFWRDHPDKDDLVRALLQHLKSEAANKKRRQEAQEKYSHRPKLTMANGGGGGNGGAHGGPGGLEDMSETAKREFSLILLGGKDRIDAESLGDDGDGDDEGGGDEGKGGNAEGHEGRPRKGRKPPASILKRRIGGDLFYQRGDYDEGMIYLSRIDKARFQGEREDPRHGLLLSNQLPSQQQQPHPQPQPLSSPQVQGQLSPLRPGSGAGKTLATSASVPALPSHMTLSHHRDPGGNGSAGPSSPSSAVEHAAVAHAVHHLSKDMKLKSIEGLYNVSCHRGFELQVLREGALATLAQIVKAEDPTLRLYGAATLLNLTTGGGGTGPTGSPHVRAKASVAPTTATMTTTRELYARLVDDGALATVLELVHTPHPTVKALCARALFRLSGDETHHFRMVHEGVVAALTQLLSATSSASFSASASASMPSVMAAAAAPTSSSSIPSEDVRQWCVNALVNLAAVPRAVTCDGLLAALLGLVRRAQAGTGGDHGNGHLRLGVCAQALLNLSILPTTRAAMVEDGAVAALSALAGPPAASVPLWETTTCVLCNLAAIKTNQEPMVKTNVTALVGELLDRAAGAHASLVNTSDDPGNDQATATAAASAVGNDEDGDEARAQILGALARIRRNCINAFAYLCCNAKLRARVPGIVPRLVTVLDDLAATPRRTDVDDELEKFALICIANLALEDRCRVSMVQDGVVPRLLAILHDAQRRDATATLAKLDCVTALSNLLLHPKNFTRLVDDGVVPALLAMIQSADTPDIQRACVYAMLNLAKDPGMKTRLAHATTATTGTTETAVAEGAPTSTVSASPTPGAIPTMLLFASKHVAHAEFCGVGLAFLHHLSTRADNYEPLYSEGAVGLLVRVLQKPSHAEPVPVIYGLWLDAATTLAHLATHPTRRAGLLEEGVLEALQHVLTVSGADQRRRDRRIETKVVLIQYAAAQILFKLHELCCQTRAEYPAFFASLLLLATQSAAKNSRLERRALHFQQKTVLRCALTIARATTLGVRGLRLVAAQVDLPPALNGIMRTGLHEAQVCAAIALCNLATERGRLAPRVWRDATTEDFIVITLLRLNSDETKEICARALFNLLTHDDTRDQMIRDGVLYALLKLARLENEEMRDLALRSLYNVSLEPTRATQLVEMEIVRVLVKMYQPEFSKEMKRLLCGILSNLSAAPGHESQLLGEGALVLLKSLAKVRDPETKVYAANLLYNLSTCGAVHELLVRDEAHVLGLVVALLRAETRDVRRYAAWTLANLSGSTTAIELMTTGGTGGHAPAPAPAPGAAATTTATTTAPAVTTATTSSPTPVDGATTSMVTVLNDTIKWTMASCIPTSAACVFALRNLLTRALNQQRLIDGHGIPTLAAILACPEMATETATLTVATDLLCALANLEHGAEGFEAQLVRDGIVKALHAIATGTAGGGSQTTTTTASSASAAERAASLNILTSLSNLSKNPASHDLMLRDGALETLALVARTSDDARAPFKGLVGVKGEDFCHHCAVLLRNLTHLDEDDETGGGGVSGMSDVRSQRLAGQPAIIGIALALAQSTSSETREHVVVALHNLARLRRCRMLLLKHDGVRVLLRLGTAATSAVKRHICGLALQLLSTPDGESGGGAGDAYLATVAQEGLVSALAALAEQHHQDVLLGAHRALHAVVAPRPLSALPGNRAEPALLATGHVPVVQLGAPADWAKVAIPNLAPWPVLEKLAVDVNNGEDADDDDEELGADSDDGSDDDVLGGAKDKKQQATTGGGGSGSSSGSSSAGPPPPMSPGHSRLRAPSTLAGPATVPFTSTAVTAPRVCSVDVVLGHHRVLEDPHMDKLKLNLEAELLLVPGPRRASHNNPTRHENGEHAATDSLSLPALGRPASSPERGDGATDGGPTTKTRKSRVSTLSLVRHEAPGPSTGSGNGGGASPVSSSPVKSPVSTSKRRSQALEPLSMS